MICGTASTVEEWMSCMSTIDPRAAGRGPRGARRRACLPVERVDVPEDHRLACLLRGGPHGVVRRAVRRPHERRPPARGLLDRVGRASELEAHVGRGQGREVAVVPRVRRELVPLGDDAPGDLRVGLDALAEREERRWSLGPAQLVEQARGVGAGTVVEGQRDALRLRTVDALGRTRLARGLRGRFGRRFARGSFGGRIGGLVGGACRRGVRRRRRGDRTERDRVERRRAGRGATVGEQARRRVGSDGEGDASDVARGDLALVVADDERAIVGECDERRGRGRDRRARELWARRGGGRERGCRSGRRRAGCSGRALCLRSGRTRRSSRTRPLSRRR